MRKTFVMIAGACLAAAVAGGCEERDVATAAGPRVSEAAAARSSVPAEPAPVGNGVVRGTVKFVGTPPVMGVIRNEPCCKGAPKELKEEAVIVGPGGGMANVVVWLKDGPVGDGSGRPAARLDQKFCRFEPHVVAVQSGQTLHVTSSDDTLHNVHWVSEQNPPANFGLTEVGASKDLVLSRAEFIKVRCDVHPWMAAHIVVTETPCFAVTKDDGAFEITGVPAGEYTLAVWHEKYGELEQRITVADDKPTAMAFEYKAPQ